MRAGLSVFAVLSIAACVGGSGTPVARLPAADAAAPSAERLAGFVDLYWQEDSGRLLVGVRALDTPLLYQSALARGVGSNDLGLDRGQLGPTRIVRFIRSGPRVLLMADNLDYRAETDNIAERQAIRESFAPSVLWGFTVVEERDDQLLIDGTPFFIRDAHGLAARLAALGEGEYRVDASRSMIYLPRTKAFPDNSEIEAIVTFTGEAKGPQLPTVVPDPTAVTVHMHHSFVRLPDDDYEPLPYDPRAGVIGIDDARGGFADYATPIGAPLKRNFGIRHRLRKVDATARIGDAVEPIVFYLDPGVPEPIRSALLDGALWWNEAFEAAGYRNAFRVAMLPDGADPMDVRYNTIQWVHRSTRGWSYGYSVIDPRTGEIIKGHVTLGSLRVRQDFMIAEGLLGPYADDDDSANVMLDMALARIRQLAAHEVGHTLGFAHNFAASSQNRSSVMDYPFPLIDFDPAVGISLDKAYGDGIGRWDIRTVMYAYQDFPEGIDRNAERQRIIDETLAAGLRYVTDADARAIGSAHPHGNLWDNGDDAIAELEHLLRVRDYALARFSENRIRRGRPLATIEEVLVPLYLLHRFQIAAVGKLIGGSYFRYALKGDGQKAMRPVAAARQQRAIEALLRTLQPSLLLLPDALVAALPPRPPGYPASRELFSGYTGGVFDPLAPAAAAAELTLRVLLDPARAARMNRNGSPTFRALIERLLAATWHARPGAAEFAVHRQTGLLALDRLLALALDRGIDPGVAAASLDAVLGLKASLAAADPVEPERRAWRRLAIRRIDRALDDPASIGERPAVRVPPGSPIGMAPDNCDHGVAMTQRRRTTRIERRRGALR